MLKPEKKNSDVLIANSPIVIIEDESRSFIFINKITSVVEPSGHHTKNKNVNALIYTTDGDYFTTPLTPKEVLNRIFPTTH